MNLSPQNLYITYQNLLISLSLPTPMISSLFKKNRATNTTMHAPKPSPTVIPQPLGLKGFATGYADNYQCQSNLVNRDQVIARSVPEVDQNPVIEDEDEDEDEDDQVEKVDNACWATYGRGQRRKFPPPLPLLARTANLSCHMPWVLQRTYRSDGSLVITEVRVKHHEYFRARREKGRLTLQLVELDENCDLFESGQCKVECNDSTVVEARKESSQVTVSPRFAASSTFGARMKNKGCTDAVSQMSPLQRLTMSTRMRAVNV